MIIKALVPLYTSIVGNYGLLGEPNKIKDFYTPYALTTITVSNSANITGSYTDYPWITVGATPATEMTKHPMTTLTHTGEPPKAECTEFVTTPTAELQNDGALDTQLALDAAAVHIVFENRRDRADFEFECLAKKLVANAMNQKVAARNESESVASNRTDLVYPNLAPSIKICVWLHGLVFLIFSLVFLINF